MASFAGQTDEPAAQLWAIASKVARDHEQPAPIPSVHRKPSILCVPWASDVDAKERNTTNRSTRGSNATLRENGAKMATDWSRF